MTNIEIPFVKERGVRYRLFEILPGALSWSILLFPIVLSVFDVKISFSFLSSTLPAEGVPAAPVFVMAYLLMWFAKSVALNIRSLQGYKTLKEHQKLPWSRLLDDLAKGKTSHDTESPKWHSEIIDRLAKKPPVVKPQEIVHGIILATYNESR